MKIENINEREDGLVDVELKDMSQEEQRLLIEKGFVELLRKYSESFKKESENNNVYIGQIHDLKLNLWYKIYLNKHQVIYADHYGNANYHCGKVGLCYFLPRLTELICLVKSPEDLALLQKLMFDNLGKEYGYIFGVDEFNNESLFYLDEDGFILDCNVKQKPILNRSYGLVLPIKRVYI